MKTRDVLVANAGLILVLLAACARVTPTPTPTQPAPTAEAAPATGVLYHFVTSQLQIPATQAQTQQLALNIDGNSQQRLENKIGELLVLLASSAPGLDLQSTVDQAVKSGQLVSLHLVKANDPLNDPSVSWLIALGQKAQSAPRFDGSDKFAIDSNSPANAPIVGSLVNGHFTGGPGTARIQIFLLGQSLEVDLIGVRLEAGLSAKGCTNGKLGGGLTVDEFRAKLLPPVADGLNQVLNANKSSANMFLQTMDSDHNGTITVQELENNPFFMAAISPDLDLLDASGKFNPGQDGVKDSYSIGVGFACVPATFTAPGE